MEEVAVRTRTFLPALLLAALLVACETAAPAATPSRSTGGSSATPHTPAPSAASSPSPTPQPEELRVAWVQDTLPEGALRRLLQPFQALELAFATASLPEEHPVSVDVVPFDLQGDLESIGEIAGEIVGDPAFVAAVVAPDLSGQRALVDALADAEVPVLSLSAREGVEETPPGTWLRFVAPVREQADAVARTASALPAAGDGICLVEAPSDGTTFARGIRRALRGTDVTEVPGGAAAITAGCGIAVWAGGPSGGAQLALELTAPGPTLVGGPALVARDFLELAGSAAEGAVAVCSCADVSTSLHLAGQRFVQAYQSEYGSAPGAYAVEAWDAAHLLIRGLREVGSDRAALVSWLASQQRFEGLGGAYAFLGGELAEPAASIRVYRLRGGRWTQVEPGSPSSDQA